MSLLNVVILIRPFLNSIYYFLVLSNFCSNAMIIIFLCCFNNFINCKITAIMLMCCFNTKMKNFLWNNLSTFFIISKKIVKIYIQIDLIRKLIFQLEIIWCTSLWELNVLEFIKSDSFTHKSHCRKKRCW